MEPALIYTDFMNTPLGFLKIQASMLGVTQVVFSSDANTPIEASEITNRCRQQLEEYFEGKRSVFDLPLDLQGTQFQKMVWNCLTRIPFGQSVSYSGIAEEINNPKAVRAVGAANGKNPIGIIVPCHRVIGRDKTLTGYAGGLERKSWLLKHEGVEFKESEKLERVEATKCTQGKLFESLN